MLIMVSGNIEIEGSLMRTIRPHINVLTKELVLDMILEECFNKPVEDVTEEERGDIDEQFDPLMDEKTAMWLDPATEAYYTFIIV